MREKEQEKYVNAYKDPNYKMSGLRYHQACAALEHALHPGDTYLDVGCGRGEMLEFVSNLPHFYPSLGIEIVPELCEHPLVIYGTAYNLTQVTPRSVVTCFDVLEHIPREDEDLVLYNLMGATERTLILSISNVRAMRRGVELHINRRPYSEWHTKLKTLFPEATVERKVIDERINAVFIVRRREEKSA